MNYWVYPLLSVLVVSLISLLGVLTLSIKKDTLNRFIIYFVSFAAGALLGDVFIHLIPELIERQQYTITTSYYILLGIIVSFAIEKIIGWHHCHLPEEEHHVHRLAYMNLIGDSLHNFIDGIIIAASFMVSFPAGVGTALAVMLHEIPQEIGDFGVLIHAGMSRIKALAYNFITAITAVLGAVLTLVLSVYTENITLFLIPFAAGNFIYIAAADLIPELHKELDLKKSFAQLIAFIAGIVVMMILLMTE